MKYQVTVIRRHEVNQGLHIDPVHVHIFIYMGWVGGQLQTRIQTQMQMQADERM